MLLPDIGKFGFAHLLVAVEWMKGSVVVRYACKLITCSHPIDEYIALSHLQDAMSEAVEGAELILYGVSEKYKER